MVVFRSPHFDQAKYNVLPLDLIASKAKFSEEDVGQTDRVVFPALLVNFVGSHRNYPVMRDGTIALIPEESVPLEYPVGSRVVRTEQEVILLDATSIPGASGAPVFLWPGPRVKKQTFNVGGTPPLLLGIMHGFYTATPRDLLTIQVATPRQMYQENSGIAIAFPSWRLAEILDYPELRTRMLQLSQSAQ